MKHFAWNYETDYYHIFLTENEEAYITGSLTFDLPCTPENDKKVKEIVKLLDALADITVKGKP